MLFDLFVVQYVTLTLFCLSVMVSTVPAYGTYLWSFVTEIFHSGQPSHGGDCKTFEVMTSNSKQYKQ
jgi:hypothetical protein